MKLESSNTESYIKANLPPAFYTFLAFLVNLQFPLLTNTMG